MSGVLEDSLMAFCRAPQQFLLDLALEGPSQSFRMNEETFLVLNDPASIHAVLNGSFEDFEKGALYDIPRTSWHDGLITVEGEVWREQHGMFAPAFSRRRIRALEPLIVDLANGLIERWMTLPEGETVDLLAAANRLAFDVVATGLLGITDQALADALFETVGALDAGETVRLHYLLKRFAGDTEGRFGRSAQAETLARMDRLCLAVADHRLGLPTQPEDMLGTVMATPEFAGYPPELQRTFLAHQAATFLSAGYITTGESIFWALYMLAKHPDAQHRARAEIVDAGPAASGGPPIDAPPFLAAVFHESQRLFPPVWFTGRVALRDVRVGELDIPAGAQVICSAYVLHRMPELWPDSEAFRPERFLPGASPPPPPRALIPFGTGRRACLGRALAQMEMSALVAMTLARFQVRLVSEAPIALTASYTMHPKETVLFRLEPLQ